MDWGAWPDVSDLIRAELPGFVATAGDPAVGAAPTRCRPWTGRQVTAHVALSFERFTALLARSRRGDLSAPFARDELAAQNALALDGFAGDTIAAVQHAVDGFLATTGDPAELMAHQFGPIPVGLQAAFGLSELTLHHDDLAAAVGRRYGPPTAAVDAVVAAWAGPLAHPDLLDAPDPWAALLHLTDRT